jgi:hypothetical protein
LGGPNNFARFQVLTAASIKITASGIHHRVVSSSWWWSHHAPLKRRSTSTRLHGAKQSCLGTEQWFEHRWLCYYDNYYYYHHHFLSQVFFLPWYFCSWASGEPHHLCFKSQLVALSLWCVMFLVWQFFCKESTECCPGIVSRYFCKLLLTIPVAPMITGMTKHLMFHILWISILRFLYFNFNIIITTTTTTTTTTIIIQHRPIHSSKDSFTVVSCTKIHLLAWDIFITLNSKSRNHRKIKRVWKLRTQKAPPTVTKNSVVVPHTYWNQWRQKVVFFSTSSCFLPLLYLIRPPGTPSDMTTYVDMLPAPQASRTCWLRTRLSFGMSWNLKMSYYTPWRRLAGEDIAPTHTRLRQ